MSEQDAGPVSARTLLLSRLCNEIVQVFKEHFGRGPTTARAAWLGPDALAVVLEGTFTAAERGLVKLNQHERLREIRGVFDYASVSQFCEPVERLTGRKVRAFVSGIDTQVDGLSVETFVLHPKDYDGPSRKDALGDEVGYTLSREPLAAEAHVCAQTSDVENA